MVEWDSKTTMLKATYKKDNKTLVLRADEGFEFIDMWNMKDIHYGNTDTDINLCMPATNYYKYNGDDYNLFTNSIEIPLYNMQNDWDKNLTLTISILADGTLNLFYTF